MVLIVCNSYTLFQGLSYLSLPTSTLYIPMDFLFQTIYVKNTKFLGLRARFYSLLCSFQNYCEMELGVLKIVAVLVIGMLMKCISVLCTEECILLWLSFGNSNSYPSVKI